MRPMVLGCFFAQSSNLPSADQYLVGVGGGTDVADRAAGTAVPQNFAHIKHETYVIGVFFAQSSNLPSLDRYVVGIGGGADVADRRRRHSTNICVHNSHETYVIGVMFSGEFEF